MKRATIAIDRKALLDALAWLDQALVRGDTTAAARALQQVYQLVAEQERRAQD